MYKMYIPRGLGRVKKNKMFCLDNVGQSIMEKLCTISFFKERFTAGFSQFSRGTAKICLLHGWLGACHQFHAFNRFS